MRSRQAWFFLLFTLAVPSFPQAPPPSGPAQVKEPAVPSSAKPADVIPERTLEFKPMEYSSPVAISPMTTVPQCGPDGSLYLDMLDPRDLRKHTLISFKGKSSQTYLPTAISDVHDLTVLGFFPSQSIVGFLVRGTKDQPGSPGPHKSPAGFAWSGYHTYIAEFDRDGSYKKSVQLPISYQLHLLAIFRSGEFLVLGYDQVNSVVRLLLLSSSGDISRTIDFPGSRMPVAGDLPYGSVEAARKSTDLIGSIAFTPYNDDILVWRRGSADAVLDVSAGGSAREVPLQVPSGFVIADLIPANDRWVAHFRLQSVSENSPFTKETYSYFELRPQDASLSSKLVISGDVTQSLACENDGNYITYQMDKDGKMVLMKSE